MQLTKFELKSHYYDTYILLSLIYSLFMRNSLHTLLAQVAELHSTIIILDLCGWKYVSIVTYLMVFKIWLHNINSGRLGKLISRKGITLCSCRFIIKFLLGAINNMACIPNQLPWDLYIHLIIFYFKKYIWKMIYFLNIFYFLDHVSNKSHFPQLPDEQELWHWLLKELAPRVEIGVQFFLFLH